MDTVGLTASVSPQLTNLSRDVNYSVKDDEPVEGEETEVDYLKTEVLAKTNEIEMLKQQIEKYKLDSFSQGYELAKMSSIQAEPTNIKTETDEMLKNFVDEYGTGGVSKWEEARRKERIIEKSKESPSPLGDGGFLKKSDSDFDLSITSKEVLIKQVNRYKNNLKSKEEKIDELEEENSKLEEQVCELTFKLEQEKRTVESLQEEKKNLEKYVESLADDMQKETTEMVEMKKAFEGGKKQIEEDNGRDREENVNLKGELETMQKELFFSLAVAVKLHLSGTDGSACNKISIADLYKRAIKEGIPSDQWQTWVPKQFKERMPRSSSLINLRSLGRGMMSSSSSSVSNLPVLGRSLTNSGSSNSASAIADLRNRSVALGDVATVSGQKNQTVKSKQSQ